MKFKFKLNFKFKRKGVGVPTQSRAICYGRRSGKTIRLLEVMMLKIHHKEQKETLARILEEMPLVGNVQVSQMGNSTIVVTNVNKKKKVMKTVFIGIDGSTRDVHH